MRQSKNSSLSGKGCLTDTHVQHFKSKFAVRMYDIHLGVYETQLKAAKVAYFLMVKIFEAKLASTEQKVALLKQLKADYLLISPTKSDLLQVVGSSDLKDGYNELRSRKMSEIISFVELFRYKVPKTLADISIDDEAKGFLTELSVEDTDHAARFQWFDLLSRPESWAERIQIKTKGAERKNFCNRRRS